MSVAVVRKEEVPPLLEEREKGAAASELAMEAACRRKTGCAGCAGLVAGMAAQAGEGNLQQLCALKSGGVAAMRLTVQSWLGCWGLPCLAPMGAVHVEEQDPAVGELQAAVRAQVVEHST
mmetsp:Transcript_58184/g.138543  ORF Transcript_58184/g.138543 Transcript_58184/m.138543 type:complete len:120 (-) Transcript_58184:799-1158(-)